MVGLLRLRDVLAHRNVAVFRTSAARGTGYQEALRWAASRV